MIKKISNITSLWGRVLNKKISLQFFCLLAAVIVFGLGALLLLFVLMSSQRVSIHSCETVGELLPYLPDPNFVVFSLQEPYTNPLASISCWHVHCEECWLRTLVSYHRNIHTTLHSSFVRPSIEYAPLQELSLSLRFRHKFKGLILFTNYHKFLLK